MWRKEMRDKKQGSIYSNIPGFTSQPGRTPKIDAWLEKQIGLVQLGLKFQVLQESSEILNVTITTNVLF